jgi:hypothetical protein
MNIFPLVPEVDAPDEKLTYPVAEPEPDPITTPPEIDDGDEPLPKEAKPLLPTEEEPVATLTDPVPTLLAPVSSMKDPEGLRCDAPPV